MSTKTELRPLLAPLAQPSVCGLRLELRPLPFYTCHSPGGAPPSTHTLGQTLSSKFVYWGRAPTRISFACKPPEGSALYSHPRPSPQSWVLTLIVSTKTLYHLLKLFLKYIIQKYFKFKITSIGMFSYYFLTFRCTIVSLYHLFFTFMF